MTNFRPIILTIFLITQAFLVPFVFAQDSATPSSTLDQTIKENLKQRIQRAIAGQNQADQSAWVGTIQTLTSDLLTITSSDMPHLVSVDDTTIFLRDTTNIDLQELAIGTAVIAIGTIDDKDILTATKIIDIRQLPQKSSKQTLTGFISEINPRATALTLTSEIGETFDLTLPSTASISANFPPQPLPARDLNLDDQVLLIYSQSDSATPDLEIELIHRISASVASPSANVR